MSFLSKFLGESNPDRFSQVQQEIIDAVLKRLKEEGATYLSSTPDIQHQFHLHNLQTVFNGIQTFKPESILMEIAHALYEKDDFFEHLKNEILTRDGAASVLEHHQTGATELLAEIISNIASQNKSYQMQEFDEAGDLSTLLVVEFERIKKEEDTIDQVISHQRAVDLNAPEASGPRQL